MSVRRVLRPVKRWVERRLVAAYADMPSRATCEAFGGPCDGRRWTMSRPRAPIWLAGAQGEHHLYVPSARDRGDLAVVRYRYAVSAPATSVGLRP